MTVKTCSIGNYMSIPANSRIVEVHLGQDGTQAVSTIDVLRFVCEYYVRSGLLSQKKVRSFGFSWLGCYSDFVPYPRKLGPGIYLAEDGQGHTNLLRTTLVLKRLMVPLEYCNISYEIVDGPDPELRGDLKALSYLSVWEEGDEEPVEAVQKRVHEFSVEEMMSLVPFKVGIGVKRYSVSSWSEFANTLIAYIYVYFNRSGRKRLLDVQCSGQWKYCDVVKIDEGQIEFNPVADGLNGVDVCQLVSDLLSGIGFDRYSVFLKCSQVQAMVPSQSAQVTNTVDLFSDGNCGEEKSCDQNVIQISGKWPVVYRQEELPKVPEAPVVKLGRHLRPRFTVE